MANQTSGSERFDSHERMIALLSVSARGALLSANSDAPGLQSVDLMLKGFAAEMTAESLINQLDRIEQDLRLLKQGTDGLRGLSDEDSLRLQMAMDRLSKMMGTLSNLLKKISDTAQGITQNLK